MAPYVTLVSALGGVGMKMSSKHGLVGATTAMCVAVFLFYPGTERDRAQERAARVETQMSITERLSATASLLQPASLVVEEPMASTRSVSSEISSREAVEIALRRGTELRAERKSGGPQVDDVQPVDAASMVDRLKATPANEQEPDAPGWRVTGSEVNLRSGPGTVHGIVGRAKLNDLLTPLSDTSESWIQVRLSDGQTAWIFGRFLAQADG